MCLSAGEGKNAPSFDPRLRCSSCVVMPVWSSHAGHRSGIKIILVLDGQADEEQLVDGGVKEKIKVAWKLQY